MDRVVLDPKAELLPGDVATLICVALRVAVDHLDRVLKTTTNKLERLKGIVPGAALHGTKIERVGHDFLPCRDARSGTSTA
jgi:hypothetical protein